MAKVCILGLDGGTFKIIDYLVSKGRLPNFKRLLEQGSRATLMSTIPPITPAAWSSFYTGTNPGKTGVVDFFRFRQGTYHLTPVSASSVRSEPIWSLAGRYGQRVCVYNIPVTYPASAVNGILISGLDAPSLDDFAIYPADLKESLLSAIPDFEINPCLETKRLVDCYKDPIGEVTRRLREYNGMQLRTIRHLMELEDWDLFVAVIRAPDALQHFFWRDVEKMMNKESITEDIVRRGEAIFACYESLDRELGELWYPWSSNRNLVFMSDHGCGTLRYEVCVNRVLAQAGLLAFSDDEGASGGAASKLFSLIPNRSRHIVRGMLGKNFARKRWFCSIGNLLAGIDWNRTSIFAVPRYGCLYTNLIGRNPMGIVSDGEERREVINRAKEALGSLADPMDGKPIFTGFYQSNEIYSGSVVDDMPDLVPEMRGFSYWAVPGLSQELNGEDIVRPYRQDWKQLAITGSHRLEGMLIMHGPDIRRHHDLGTAEIVDVVPTVARLLGLPTLDHWDGRVLSDAFTTEVVPVAGQEQTGVSQETEGNESFYSEEDEDKVRKHLEDLGYL